MTTPTPTELNRIIAERCGKCVHKNVSWADVGDETADYQVCDACGKRPDLNPYPDYSSDLNAMHEAEKTLTPDEQAIYEARLYDACGVKYTAILASETFKVFCATALQSAQAFVAATEPH